MNTPTYKEQYNKIIDAYFKDEIKPFKEEFCFCGTLSPNKNWSRNQSIDCKILPEYPYTVKEYGKMEMALFSKISTVEYVHIGLVHRKNDIIDEDELFNGMCAALEVLKQIHIERGEIIDEVPVFVKRELAVN